MAETREIYPEPDADRRLFPHLPDHRKSRRLTGERFRGNVHAEVYRNPGEATPFFETTIDNISVSGAVLRIPSGADAVSVGDRLFIRFAIPPGTLPEGYETRVAARVRVVRRENGGEKAAVQFEESLTKSLSRTRWRFFEWSGVLLIILTLAVIALIRMNSFFYFLFDVPVFFYGICSSVFLVSRFVIALFYRNVPVAAAFTPSVTIVIPCFNEENFIARTMRSALDQDYPEDKLTVIVVDDGSTDRSLERIMEFKEKAAGQITGDRLKVLPQDRNRGKRHVLAAGARAAESELIIFVDSDSFLEPEAVRRIVQPFGDSRVGAVCGRCEVENKWTNYLTKMQAVRYFIAFQVFKAAESVFDSVTCLSGPLSCYRRELVMKHLDAWLHQSFLGYPATFGDDRSLTNFILPDNWVVYQHEAVCSTIVPSTLRQFLTQQMRWKRSWLRESFRASLFMWKREPFMVLSFYAGLLLPILAPLVVFRAFVFIPLVYGYFPVTFLLGFLMMAMLISSTYLFLKRSSMWIYGGLFCVFYLGILLWQMIPATLTFWKSEWGTRETAKDIEARERRQAAG